MRNILLCVLSLLSSLCIHAQIDQQLPEFSFHTGDIRTQMEFLASDYLAGRRTGSEGNNIAAAYIAAHLRAYGYNSPEGADNYLQHIPFVSTAPPTSSTLNINKQQINADNFLVLTGPAIDTKAKGVFAGHGWVDEATDHNDYGNIDVRGKVVFVLPGSPDGKDPSSIFKAMPTKQKLAAERGAIALIELYQLPFPWGMFTNFFGGETLRVDDNEEKPNITYAWLNATDAMPFTTIQQAKKLKVRLSSSRFIKKDAHSQNVIGVLEGTDPELKDEYLLITAHYDHVGVGKQGGGPYTEQDSIFNGARDNAFGTVAMLNTAKALADVRPARSIIILAVTGEELGLLGSAYYVDNPIIPLEQTIFNFNTDGAGYSDTSAVSIFGWNRTGTNEMIEAGTAPFNLTVIPDPAPEQNLFDRSDNVSFAKKGIPALSFSPGFSEFNNEILQHYHQVSDEASSIDYNYLTKYCQAFAHACRMIANHPHRPQWVEGDKYEAAGKALYQQD